MLDFKDGVNPRRVFHELNKRLPENAIVCDESVSSGRDFFPLSWHAAPHDYLQLTGGAIGLGVLNAVLGAVTYALLRSGWKLRT